MANDTNTEYDPYDLQGGPSIGSEGPLSTSGTSANQYPYIPSSTAGVNPNQDMGPPTALQNQNWLSNLGASFNSQVGDPSQDSGPQPQPSALASIYSYLTGDKNKNNDNGLLGDVAQGLGISSNLKDPKNMESIIKLMMGAGGALGALHRRGTAQNGMTPQQMLQSISPNGSGFNPSQQAAANGYFNTPVGSFANRARQYASDMPSPMVSGVGTNGMVTGHFANGGMVNTGAAIDPTNMQYANQNQYPYQQAQPESPVNNNYADGGKVDSGSFVSDGALSLVHGKGGGQDDLVHAKLSPGEYVMDADTVASLGDGNNAHGAKVLDAWREELRAHKRSADSDSIPPQAKAPSHYLKGGALTAMHNAKGK